MVIGVVGTLAGLIATGANLIVPQFAQRIINNDICQSIINMMTTAPKNCNKEVIALGKVLARRVILLENN